MKTFSYEYFFIYYITPLWSCQADKEKKSETYSDFFALLEVETGYEGFTVQMRKRGLRVQGQPF